MMATIEMPFSSVITELKLFYSPRYTMATIEKRFSSVITEFTFSIQGWKTLYLRKKNFWQKKIWRRRGIDQGTARTQGASLTRSATTVVKDRAIQWPFLIKLQLIVTVSIARRRWRTQASVIAYLIKKQGDINFYTRLKNIVIAKKKFVATKNLAYAGVRSGDRSHQRR